MTFTSNFVEIWPRSWFNTYLGTKTLVNKQLLPVLTWWAFPISEDHSCRKSVNAFRRDRSRDRQTGEMPNRPIQTGPRFARNYFWFIRRAFPFLTALTNFASWQANEIRARNATSRAARPRFASAGAATTTSRSCTQRVLGMKGLTVTTLPADTHSSRAQLSLTQQLLRSLVNA